MPVVSVVMPAYNAAPYIGEAIRSILDQTFTDWELIIVNDGSTDATLEEIKKFTDARIKLISLEVNAGNRVAANTAMQAATGKYIARMDADDISPGYRLAHQVAFMEANPLVGFSGGHIQLFGSDNNLWRYPVTDDELGAARLFDTPVVQGCAILRTDLLHTHNVWYNIDGESYAEDIDFFYRLRKHAACANLDEVLLHYRKHDSNITRQLGAKGFELNAPLFRSILADWKLFPTDEEFRAHFWLNSRFLQGIKPADVVKVWNWKQKLIAHNAGGIYAGEPFFTRSLEQKWSRFYYMLPQKISFIRAYMKAQRKWEFKKVLYSIKKAVR